jgi:hypothetical protein
MLDHRRLTLELWRLQMEKLEISMAKVKIRWGNAEYYLSTYEVIIH